MALVVLMYINSGKKAAQKTLKDIRRKKLTDEGQLEEIAKTITNTIKFSGPFFFQTIEDKNGIPKLTEINPRIAGIMSLSSNSGVNIHALAVKIFMGETIKIPKLIYGIYLTRYFNDIFLTEKELKKSIS